MQKLKRFFSLRDFKNIQHFIDIQRDEAGMEGDVAGLVADVRKSNHISLQESSRK